MDALFNEALRLNMRLLAGKVMMDRHAPDYLSESAEQSYRQTRELIERWHRRGRLGYAITPRFAPTSTPELLAAVRQLREEFPDTAAYPFERKPQRSGTGKKPVAGA